jgi:hypothetical protein
VFDFVSDERNEASFNPDMTSVTMTTPPPIGVAMTVEFTDFERPTRLGSKSTTSRVTFVGSLFFMPEGEGTWMKWDWHVRPSGLLRFLGAPDCPRWTSPGAANLDITQATSRSAVTCGLAAVRTELSRQDK